MFKFEDIKKKMMMKMNLMDVTIKGIEDSEEYKLAQSHNSGIRECVKVINEHEDEIKALIELCDKKEKGLLVELPVPEGDDMWAIVTMHDAYDGTPYEIASRVQFTIDRLKDYREGRLFKTEVEANAVLQSRKGR